MKLHKISFTDLSQLGELNESVWRLFDRGHEVGDEVKPNPDDTAAPSERTVVADQTGGEATEVVLPCV